MKKIFTTFIAMFFVFSNVFSDPVKEKEAKQIAENFYHSFAPKSKAVSSINKTITETYKQNESFYIFAFDKGGFVIVSADDNAVPVLGYSFTSPIEEKFGSNTRYLFDRYNMEIAEIKKLKSQAEDIKVDWDKLRSAKLSGEIKATGPILETTWNQSPLYNKYCPTGTPTGCVATAMSQIMNYHEWPASGNGSHKYIQEDHPEYGTHSADFKNEIYDWANMPNSLSSTNTETEIHAIATLNRHAGISVNMNYDPDGSGAFSQDVLFALTSYFKYNVSSIDMLSYTSSDETDLIVDAIKNEINNNRPVYYSGQGPDGGHAWVCDGYDQDNKVHINWGWGGSANGYFLVSAMKSGSMDFSESNSIIIGIKPGSVYQEAQWVKQSSAYETASRGIRNIAVINNRVAWASAYDGSGDNAHVVDFTRTIDGNNWVSGTINATGIENHDIAMLTATDANTAWAALYGPSGGGKIVKTSDGGQTWNHQSTAGFSEPSGFPNVIHFWDANNGWCQGDPNGGYFELYTTTDGGETWNRVPEANIPANQDKEYGTIGYYAVYGDIVWFATNKGRVFKSADKGYNWDVYDTPISEASFEISFKNENTGVIQTRSDTDSKAYISNDGGENWTLITSTGNFYTGCFRYIPGSNTLISSGADAKTPFMGISYSTDDGASFTDYAEFYQRNQFLAIGAANTEAIWAGGYNSDKYSGGMWHYGQILDTLDLSVNKRKFCLNDSSVVFVDNSMEEYDTYSWEFGNGASPSTITGAGPHTVKYTTSGSKSIKLIVSKGAEEEFVLRNDLIYISSETPVLDVIDGEASVDVFNTLTYSVTNIDEVTYSWEFPTEWTGNSKANSADITFLSPGTETIKVTPSNVCGEGTPATLDITANCVTTNPGAISGDASVLVNESDIYTVEEQDYISFKWELPTLWTGSSTTNSIEVSFGGEAAVDSIKVTSTSVCGDGESSYFKVTVVSLVGIDEIELDNVTVYPNPAKDYIQISGIENSDIYIYNNTGTLVKKINKLSINSPINISDLETGIYHVSIVANDKVYTKTISIAK